MADTVCVLLEPETLTYIYLCLNLGPIWMGACSFKLEPVVAAATTATDSNVLNLRLKIIHLVIDIYWYKSETINLYTVSNRAGPASTIVYNTTSCQVRTDSIIRTVCSQLSVAQVRGVRDKWLTLLYCHTFGLTRFFSLILNV